MKQAELEPYFRIHHGGYSWLNDMNPATHHTISQFETEGLAVSQLPLPLILDRAEGDRLVWMPHKVTEKLLWQQDTIDSYSQKIKLGVFIPQEGKT